MIIKNKIRNLERMFQDCKALKDINNFSGMFYGCSSLSDIKGLENWNVSNGNDFSYMF